MSGELPRLDRHEFDGRIAAVTPVELSDETLERLWIHYRELVRWNARLSLVGPGTATDLVRRHFGESLAALPLLDRDDAVLVDVGSGAGFPGLVLAAARPDLEVWAVESRQKKWAFLELVAEKAELPCRCLNARVSGALPSALPRQIDVVATRAVKFSRDQIEALTRCLGPRGRFLIWSGREITEAATGLRRGRQVGLEGAERRRIVEFHPPAAEGA